MAKLGTPNLFPQPQTMPLMEQEMIAAELPRKACYRGVLFTQPLLLLLLSHLSRVQLCVTPETAAHQAPPYLGFSRQEHWSGLPFPSPMHESEK